MLGITLRFPDAPVLVGNLIIGGALLGLIIWGGWLTIQWRRNQKSQGDTDDIGESSQDTEQPYETPIYKAVDYVAIKIDDSNSDQCYPSARRDLRNAAFEGRIKMYGKRELKDGYHSDLKTPVPPEFWDNQELNELATSEAYVHHEHTRGEIGEGFNKLADDREKYWDIRVSMDEVKKLWP